MKNYMVIDIMENNKLACIRCGFAVFLIMTVTGLSIGYIGKVQYDRYCASAPTYNTSIIDKEGK